MSENKASDIDQIITDDFVSAFGDKDSDYLGAFAHCCAAFYPDGLPVGVLANDPRVQKIIARIRKVQEMAK